MINQEWIDAIDVNLPLVVARLKEDEGSPFEGRRLHRQQEPLWYGEVRMVEGINFTFCDHMHVSYAQRSVDYIGQEWLYPAMLSLVRCIKTSHAERGADHVAFADLIRILPEGMKSYDFFGARIFFTFKAGEGEFANSTVMTFELLLGTPGDTAELLTSDMRAMRDQWKETALLNQRSKDYYRGLITQIGEMLGEEAYISDDGSRQQDVLCAKIPELVKTKCSALEASKRLLTRSSEKHGECLEALRRINIICGEDYDIESPTKVLELVQKRLEDASIQRRNLPEVRDEDRLGG